MRKIFGIILGILFLLIFLKPQQTNADVNVLISPNPILVNDGNLTISLTSNPASFIKDKNYTFTFFSEGEIVRDKNNFDPAQISDFNARSKIVKPQNCQGDACTILQAVQDWSNYGPLKTLQKNPGKWKVVVFLDNFNTGRVVPNPIEFTMLAQGDATLGIPAIGMEHSKFQAYQTKETPVYILNPKANTDYTLWFDGEQSARWTGKFSDEQIQTYPNLFGDLKAGKTSDINMGSASTKNLCLSQASATFNSVVGLRCDFRLKGIIVTTLPPADQGGPITSNETGFPRKIEPSPPPGPCESGFCKTAVGNISTDPAGFVRDIFGRVLSLAGGIAIILIIISGYRLMASGGNPEKLQHAREQLTSAVIGLLFIIFSLSLLQIIGVDILRIPGLSK